MIPHQEIDPRAQVPSTVRPDRCRSVQSHASPFWCWPQHTFVKGWKCESGESSLCRRPQQAFLGVWIGALEERPENYLALALSLKKNPCPVSLHPDSKILAPKTLSPPPLLPVRETLDTRGPSASSQQFTLRRHGESRYPPWLIVYITSSALPLDC
ncbi:hypothetical protein M5K25_006613 [Dendrobium thyrsiflorum]|uniref:Uncharacterized protein n=1 Tax=Dendrobium thyrsiflorum TaxID=117978 RepID=A0ABD0VCA1_DENTH